MRDLFEAWRAARERRSAAGELRASAEEREAFERFIEHVSEEDRIALLDASPNGLCECGHPRTHHDPTGSCFHVVGCATVCICHRSY